MSKWTKLKDAKLKNDTYYELCYWNPDIHWEKGGMTEGSFSHQGILKYDNGFKEGSYWLRPTPTYVREIVLSTPITI
jgi:hypothetical protein